jgi:hypothetical protein
VAGVEMMRCGVEIAAEDEAAGTTASTQSAKTHRETLDRTADDASRVIGRPGTDLPMSDPDAEP